MARSLVIEEESGTACGWVHPHNGYYAGNFFTPNMTAAPTATSMAPTPPPAVDAR